MEVLKMALIQGDVTVFQYNENSWIQIGNPIAGEKVGDYSAYSVSLSSDGTIIATSSIYNGDGGDRSGHVRLINGDNTHKLIIIIVLIIIHQEHKMIHKQNH